MTELEALREVERLSRELDGRVDDIDYLVGLYKRLDETVPASLEGELAKFSEYARSLRLALVQLDLARAADDNPVNTSAGCFDAESSLGAFGDKR